MARNTRLYSMDAVDDYMNKNGLWDCAEIIEGVLLNNIIIWHGGDVVEVFEEKYLIAWSSAYIRHVYRKGLPKKWDALLEEYYQQIEACE